MIMRVLWFSVTPALFNTVSHSYNGGGWIASLESIIRSNKNVELGIAFNFEKSGFKYQDGTVSYYPIPIPKGNVLKRFLNKKENERKSFEYWMKIINDFHPDIIQIFGSENEFGHLCGSVDVPVVIHMQGCLPSYYNALFPIGMNIYDFIFGKGLSFKRRLIGLRSPQAFHKNAEKEIETIKRCKYFMGRTDWDKRMVHLFNPTAVYFHCEEALRDSFMNGNAVWTPDESRFIITSTISNPWYKGVDLILKTAKILKNYMNFEFEWNVYGISDIKFYEHKYGIDSFEVNVIIKGIISKESLADALCHTSCYVHPSYIDNSPNSVCEAQIVGVPVIATNVGGLSTIIKDGETGILVPANDPFILASRIVELAKDKVRTQILSEKTRIFAMNRHNPDHIGKVLISIYSSIINND